MADNMIELIAKLDYAESYKRISDQIRTMQNQLNSSLGINLNINPTINASNVSVANIQNSIQQAVKAPMNIELGDKINLNIGSMAISKLHEQLDSLDISADSVLGLENRLQNLGVTITSITPAFSKLGETGKQVLSSLTVKGVSESGDVVNYVERFNLSTGRLSSTSTKLTKVLAEVAKSEKSVANEAKAQAQEQQKLEAVQTKLVEAQGNLTLYGKKIGENKGLREQYLEIQKLIKAFDDTAPLQKQNTEIVRIQKALQNLKADIDEVRKSAEATASTSIVKSDIYKDISAFGSKGDRLSTTALTEVAKAQIQAEIGTSDKVTRVSKAAEDAAGNLQKFYVQVERADKSVEVLTYNLNAEGKAFEYLGKTIREADNSTSAFKKVSLADQWKKQEQDLRAFVTTVQKANIEDKQLAKSIADLQTRIATGGDTNAMSDFIDKLNLAKATFKALKAEANRDNAINQFNANVSKATATLDAFASKNSRVVNSLKLMSDGTTTFKQRWQELNTQLANAKTPEQLRLVNTEFAEFKRQAEAAGLASTSLFTSMASQLKMLASRWLSLYGAIRIVRDITEEIKTLDASMISLRRVTEATDEQFAEFQKSATETAKQYGAVVSEVIDATATFSRSGYELADAKKLGEVATLYKNIGDGITIDDASKTLVSVIKAFNEEVGDSERIIDRIIKVANNASIDPEGLGNSLQRVSSAMREANNSLDETIALITTANEIVQDPDVVANGWRTVALRIRGAKAELEEAGLDADGMVESTAKLRDLVMQISGVDIMLDDTTFKSTYQIIKEIGAVWGNINDINRAALLEGIAGKRQSNIVAAALNNYTRLDEVLKLSTESMGEAQKVEQAYAEGLTYAFNQLKTAFTGFAQAVMSSDFLKGFVGVATSLLNVLTAIVDKIGIIPTVIGGLALAGRFNIVGVITGIINAVRMLGVEETRTAIATTVLKAALNTLASVGITLAITALIGLISKLANAEKEASEAAEKARQEAVQRTESYETEADSMDSLRDQYVKLATTTSNLVSEKEKLSSIQNDINDGISNQKNQVDLLNNSLSENLELLRQQEVQNARNIVRENLLDYEKASEYLQLGITVSSDKRDILEALKQAVGSEYVQITGQGLTIGVDFETGENIGLKNTLDILNKIIDKYATWENRDNNLYQLLLERQKKYQGVYDEYYQIVETYQEAERILNESKIFDTEGFSESYSELIDKSQEAILNFNKLKESGATTEQIKESEQYIISLKSQLNALVGSNVRLKNEIASVFDGIGFGTTQAQIDIQALRSGIDFLTTSFDNLKKVFDDDVKEIDKLSEAMQKVAEGEFLSRKEAWEIFDIDTEGILTDIRLVNGEYKLSYEQLETLMDKRIEKQKESILAVKAQVEAEIETAKTAVSVAQARLKIMQTTGINSAGDVALFKQYKEQLTVAQETLDAASATLRNTNRMLADIETYSGNVVDYSKVLKAKTKEIDDDLKAQKKTIDAQIKSIQVAVDKLEAEKDELEQQKDILNEQKDSLEEIVNQYKNAANAVKRLTDEEKDALTEERDERKEYWSKQIEDSKDYYNAQIDALKEEREAKKEVESLEKKKLDIQEKQLAVQEKQRELEEAREKRVRTYSASRGWTLMSDQDAIATAQKNFDEAQKNLVDAQKAYQDEIEENSFNAKIKNLENLRDAQNKLFEQQRDAEIKGLEKQIKAVEDYAKAWSKATDDVTTAEEERLAQELLGVDWREKIASKDLSIIDNFRVNFNRYNSQLKNLTDIEIKNLEKSIKAKDNEIKARKAEIDAWNAQKTEIENAANAMKETLEEYYNNLANANERIVSTADDTSIRVGRSFGEMVVDIWNAKENFSSFMGEMADNAEAEGNRMVKTAMGIANVFTKISDMLEARKKANDIASYVSSGHNIWDVLTGDKFAEGGVNTKTGFAWLDGTPKKPELVLNNADTAKLYNLIHNSNFVNYAPKPNSQPTNATARFDGATFIFNGVQNPQQFAQQMEVWISHETARSRVNGVGN